MGKFDDTKLMCDTQVNDWRNRWFSGTRGCLFSMPWLSLAFRKRHNIVSLVCSLASCIWAMYNSMIRIVTQASNLNQVECVREVNRERDVPLRPACCVHLLRHLDRCPENETDLQTIGIQRTLREQTCRASIHHRQGDLHAWCVSQIDLCTSFRFPHSGNLLFLAHHSPSVFGLGDQWCMSNIGAVWSVSGYSRYLRIWNLRSK